MSNDRVDALVVGAGPAGSGAARLLAASGWKTVVIERRSFPRHKVCGEFLSPEAGFALRELGLEEAAAALSPVKIGRVRIHAAGGRPLEVPLPSAAMGISRHALDAALLDAARRAGAEVRTGTAVLRIHREADGYVCAIRRNGAEETIRTRIVIGAWGAGARRTFADPRAAAPAASGRLGVKIHVAGIDIADTTEMFWFPGGYLGLSPIPGGHVNAAALLDPRAFGGGLASAADWIDAAAGRHPVLARLWSGAVPLPGTQAAAAPVIIDRRPLAWGTCPLIGDAALRIPPLCGDGMSIALRSAAVCARLVDRRLRGDISEVEWRREYERFFRMECAGPLRFGRLMQTLLAHPAAARVLLAAGRAVPDWAAGMVRRTRLALPGG